MPAWALPLIIQAAEALFVGVGTSYATHMAGGDAATSLLAGVMAALAKIVPSQAFGQPASPSSK